MQEQERRQRRREAGKDKRATPKGCESEELCAVARKETGKEERGRAGVLKSQSLS